MSPAIGRRLERLADASADAAELEADGRIRYLGVTHYTSSAYDELEAVMRKETLDFVQLNYSLDDRAAERKLLPLAAERGIAILVNVPFGGGGLLRRLRNRPLPDWAAEIDCTSWAQILLKFVLAHPAVTCVIPGTGNPAHMADNCGAGNWHAVECGFAQAHHRRMGSRQLAPGVAAANIGSSFTL